MNKYNERINDKGFSLLELVIAVGILIILSVGGTVSYNAIMKDQRNSTISLVASNVMNEVLTNVIDFDDNTTAQMAVDDFNNQSNNQGFVASLIVNESADRSDRFDIIVVISDTTNKVEDYHKTSDKLNDLPGSVII